MSNNFTGELPGITPHSHGNENQPFFDEFSTQEGQSSSLNRDTPPRSLKSSKIMTGLGFEASPSTWITKSSYIDTGRLEKAEEYH
jgi:nitroimidazol reductase NimA-like FMN-containing flavoprotein (pyridoxamine 5'-phosphate oxidase superfamily)